MRDNMKKDKVTKEENTTKGKKLSGIVVSDKMTGTIVVEVGRYFKHPKYGKYVQTRKKYKAHDEGNTAGIGDKVEIIECRPISKDKTFKLNSILSKAPSSLEEVKEDNE
jgi:small subunit ribosomal protein S17